MIGGERRRGVRLRGSARRLQSFDGQGEIDLRLHRMWRHEPEVARQVPACAAWNTLVESVAESAVRPRYAAGRGLLPAEAVATLAEIDATDAERTPTGLEELDRVLGGGIVAGGVVLIGGDPGHRQVDPAAAGARRAGAGDEGALRHRRGERRAGGAALAPPRPGRERGARARRDSAREDPGDPRGRAARGRGDRLDPDRLQRAAQLRAGLGGAGARVRGAADPLRQGERRRRSSSSATSPRTARSPGRACWSTSSTPCSISRATRTRAFAWCGRSRTASAPSTRSASSR